MIKSIASKNGNISLKIFKKGASTKTKFNAEKGTSWQNYRFVNKLNP